MKKTANKSILVFTLSFIVFFGLTVFSNNVLATYEVTSVRFSSALNPILGIAFGWPAILGCGFANFACDLLSANYGLTVGLIGLIPQMVYGALPYYVWSKRAASKANITRLDSPGRTVLFAVLMAVNSIVIGLFVGVNQWVTQGHDFWGISVFAALNDFDMCMIVGLPLMSLLDWYASQKTYKKKRTLSENERIILFAGLGQVVVFIGILLFYAVIIRETNPTKLWGQVFLVASYAVNIVQVLSLGAMYFVAYLKKKHSGLRIFEKKNGTVFVDEKRRLEFVSFPGNNLENRVKSDAMGLEYDADKRTKRPRFEESWQTMLSVQHGCPMKCRFCDCPSYGYYGNVSLEDFRYQMDVILQNTGFTHTEWFEVDFMRMGEPSLNDDVLKYIEFELQNQIRSKVSAEVVYPTICTMFPRTGKNRMKQFLREVARIKNEVYDGNLALQFSITSTDAAVRKTVYRNLSLPLEEIAEIAEVLPMPKGRKYQLNFPITKDSIVDAEVIDRLFDKEKFVVKFTPLHETYNALANGFEVTTEYDDFGVFRHFEEQFLQRGWDVMTFLDRREEDEDSLTCGNLLLPNIRDKVSAGAAEKKKIGVLVAIELDAIFKLYDNCKELAASKGYRLFEIEKDDYLIYVLKAGMGECAAAAGVQYLISECKVEAIVNFGVVGGLVAEMKKQKVCLVEKVVHYKYDCSEFMDLAVGQVDGHDSIYLSTSANLIQKARIIMPTIPLVTCCSGDKFISTQQEKEYLHDTFNGDICDMESSGIVLTCEANDVPCILFKAVSDGLADGADGFYAELESASLRCLKVADKIMEKISLIER